MTEIDVLKGNATIMHVSFEDIEELRKEWTTEAGNMAEINAAVQPMEFVRNSTTLGPSIGLGTRELHDFLAAHTVLVDMAKDVTASGSDAFVNCIAKTLQGIAKIYQDAEDRNLRDLAKLGVKDWKPPTKAEAEADYWKWRNR